MAEVGMFWDKASSFKNGGQKDLLDFNAYFGIESEDENNDKDLRKEKQL